MFSVKQLIEKSELLKLHAVCVSRGTHVGSPDVHVHYKN